MNPIPSSRELFDRANGVESTFRVANNIYVIGSLEQGVTVYSQQIRALNLVWSLWERIKREASTPQQIAVVGGGIAGLTAAASAVALFDTAEVTLFEKRWDLCPLQLGSDNRWLHPRIFDWPRKGSRAPSASLPVLDWSEGRASDVARQIIKQFSQYSESSPTRLKIYVGVNRLQIAAKTCKMEWIGTKSQISESFLKVERSEGDNKQFDIIIIAGGFGLESGHKEFFNHSYWGNDQLAQPVLDGTKQSYLISGYGDGAIVDLCRLTLSQFRQDSILYDLFGAAGIDHAEQEIRNILKTARNDGISEIETLERLLPTVPNWNRLSSRVRKDTKVTMHLSGNNCNNHSISDTFSGRTSFLNRFMFFLLFRLGAFGISFDKLDKAIRKSEVAKDKVICRHGTDPKNHLLQLFSDPDHVKSRLIEIRSAQKQKPERYWEPGCFPPP